MLTLQLAVRDADRAPAEVTITEPKALLGRAPHCDVVLDQREFGASGEHARIEQLGGAWYLFDQGSTNGTALNGTRIRPHTSVPLATNDKIYIGRWVIRCRITRPTSRFVPIGESDPRAEQVLTRLKQATDMPSLKAGISEALATIEPWERSNVLRKAAALAEPGPLRQAIGAEIERRDALREACYEAMTSLSAHHTGNEHFNTPDEVMRFFRLADQALEMLLEFIMGSLSSRRTFEQQFSAKVTRFFGGGGGNPIKKALEPKQVGQYLMKWEDERDAETIKKNLEEVLGDLTSHQLAVVGGVQRALRRAFERLDPEAKEQNVDAGWLGGPFARSRAWTQFKEEYRELLENETKLFNEIIYPSLREGYLQAHEDQRAGDDGDDGAPDDPQETFRIE